LGVAEVYFLKVLESCDLVKFWENVGAMEKAPPSP
jgi:hypothetical protein